MSRVLHFVALFVALVACNKPKPEQPAPKPVSACARVADHLVSLMSGATKHAPEATDPLRRVVEERCDKDAWSTQSTECLLALDSLADGNRCQAMMTQAQIEAFQRGTEAAMVELRGQLAESPPQNDAAAADAAAD
jgi:hypothetical protein